ncbi:MAG: PASTA domain-containing protein [Nocardioides sp.]
MTELEERARYLLQAAADTIDLGPGVESVVRRRPVWPMVAAAAVVAALLVTLPFVLSGERDPEPAPPPGPATVQVPQTLYMTTEQATETLEAAGLEVTVRGPGVNECDLPEDRVVASKPAAGAAVAPGTTVRIDLPNDLAGAAFCIGPEGLEDAIGLLDLARFGTTELQFAPTVRIWVDGEVTQTLTFAEARDPDAWADPSPLTRLMTGLETSDRLVTWIDRDPAQACGPEDPPAELAGQEPTVIDPIGPVDGIFGCSWVRVYRSGDVLTGVVTDVTSTEWSPTEQPILPLAGLMLDDGRRIELLAHTGGEWTGVEIHGVDERIRCCVTPPSERDPAVTAAISAWAIAQRNDTSPYEIYGTTSAEVARVVVRHAGNEQEANLLRVTDGEALEQAGITEPFGLFFAELSPGTTAGEVDAIAYDASGQRLGSDDFAHLHDQPPRAMIGGRPQS